MIFEACHDLIVMGKSIVSQKLGYLRDATGGLYYKKTVRLLDLDSIQSFHLFRREQRKYC